MSPTGATWFTTATTAVVRHLPFGLSTIIAPSLLGFAAINGCTFALDLSLLTVFHGVLHWPVPLSITLSYGTATSVSYLLNRKLNFHSHGLVGRQVTVYAGVVVVNYLAFILGVGSAWPRWALSTSWPGSRPACAKPSGYTSPCASWCSATSSSQILDDDVHRAVARVGLDRAPDLGGDLRHRDAVAADDVHLEVVVAQHDAGHAAAGQVGADATETAT